MANRSMACVLVLAAACGGTASGAGPRAKTAPGKAPAQATPTPTDKPVHDDDAAVAEVLAWVASTMEWGREPKTAEVVWRDVRTWPFIDGEVPVRLVAFEMDDGRRSIAVTGPITWCFLQLDFRAFSHTELVKLYAGWFINFAMISNEKGRRSQAKAASVAELERTLADQGFTSILILDRLHIGEDTYVSARAMRDGQPLVLAGLPAKPKIYRPDLPAMKLPPLYWYLGDTFYSE